MEIVRTSTNNDGLLNLSHITATTDLDFATPRKNHHGGYRVHDIVNVDCIIITKQV